MEDACVAEVQEVVTERQPVVILCRDSSMVLVTEEGQQRIEVPGHPVLGRWLGDVLAVATFEGEIDLWDGSSWTRIPTGAGPVATAFALDDEHLLVTTERKVTRVFNKTSESWVMDLPRSFDASVPTPSGIRGLRSAGGADYEWAWDLLGGGLDASAFGGIAGMALHTDGVLLAIGHADGTVDLWNTETGELERSRLAGGNVAKAVLWRGDTLIVNNGLNHQWTGGEWEHWPRKAYQRRLFALGELVVGWATPGRLFFHRAEGEPEGNLALSPSANDMVSDGDKLWSVDSLGQVRTIDMNGVYDEFRVDGSGRVIVLHVDTVAVAAEGEVILMTRAGERLWGVPATSPVTELTTDERFVVVGTQTGRVDVLDASTGRLLAEHQPHSRRVSRLILTDDVLFTGSWDGLVTRMGLRPLTVSPRVLKAETLADWSLGVDDLRD